MKALLETLVLVAEGDPSGPGAGGVEGRTQRRQTESGYTEVTWKDGKHGREKGRDIKINLEGDLTKFLTNQLFY